jgi:oligopeptide transport system ATP-binding protein
MADVTPRPLPEKEIVPQSRSEPILDVADLEVTFETPEGTIHAVNGVSFQLQRGETLAILGESGCGKSVTVLAVMGLVKSPPGRVRAGHVRYRDVDLLGSSPSVLRRIRGAQIAMIFQDPITALDPGKTVGHQIGEMFRVHEGLSRREARRRSIGLMDRVGIPSATKRVDDYPHQFSGGMSQRVMIAMAIALEPEILIADEPTTALDVTVQAQIMELLNELQRESGLAMILITHDLELIAENAERAAVMYAGRFVEKGPMGEVYKRPAHPYTEALLLSVPRMESRRGRLEVIGGRPPILTERLVGCPFHPRCKRKRPRCETDEPPLRSVEAERESACHYAEELLHG